MMKIANYIMTTWRHILRHKLFSAINVLGLAIGLAAVMLIALFVRDEMSYDNFWSKADRIYRTHTTFSPPGRDPMYFVSTPGPVIAALKKDFPEIEHGARVTYTRPTLTSEGNSFLEYIALVDPDITSIFDFDVIEGDIDAALRENTGLILNQTQAQKYFPNQSAIGQIVTLDFDNYQRDYSVMAVIRDIPENTQLDVNAMALIVEEDWSDDPWLFEDWFSLDAHTFYTLKEGIDNSVIESKMTEFIDRNFPKLPIGDQDVKASSIAQLKAVNVKDLHLKSVGMSERKESGNINTVMTFSAIAILILIIASINFMNLSTARASQRAKEVSLRKVAGASRKNLIVQFLGESILLTLLGLLIALAMLEVSLPYYNEILGKNILINYFSSDLVLLTALAIFVGLIGGIYPAFFLSGFRPAQILKANKTAESSASANLRAALVIIQFTVSIALFVSTAVVYGQMQYARNMDLGYDKENILSIEGVGRDEVEEKLEFLVNELKRIPDVNNVTWSVFLPGHNFENNRAVRTQDMPLSESLLVSNRQIGYDFFDTFGIEMIVGRDYQLGRSDERPSAEAARNGTAHRASVILNQTAVRQLGFASAEEALGNLVYTDLGNVSEKLEAELEIIGVIPDLHFESLKRNIRADIYLLQTNFANSISIRYQGDPNLLISRIETIWQQEFPGIPFSYEFLSDALSEQYSAEQGQASMFAAFSGLAILIACLGLYGLASFTAERRTKEIGIRKVMGADVFDIVKLLLWQFSKPVVIANLIAWPLSFYTMSIWLESFAYRIENLMIIGFCLMAGFGALLIAWGTVASNSIRVARTNPIKALRYE